MYAEVRDDDGLVTAVMPAPFQECSPEGSLAGCRFKYDSPEEQCAENRTGGLHLLVVNELYGLLCTCMIVRACASI